jgi:hypothetical protein
MTDIWMEARSGIRHTAATILALLLSLLVGGRSPAEERSRDGEAAQSTASPRPVAGGDVVEPGQDPFFSNVGQTAAPAQVPVSTPVPAPVSVSESVPVSRKVARKPWETRGHPRKAAAVSESAAVAEPVAMPSPQQPVSSPVPAALASDSQLSNSSVRRPRTSTSARVRKPWETRGHPRKVAPTPREGSANGPRAP